jgi:hypothetical protein
MRFWQLHFYRDGQLRGMRREERTENRCTGRALHVGRLLGALMLAVGALILTGTEKVIEGWLVAVSPEWLTAITTHF